MSKRTPSPKQKTHPLAGLGRRVIQFFLLVFVLLPFIIYSGHLLLWDGYDALVSEQRIAHEIRERVESLPRRQIATVSDLKREWERAELDIQSTHERKESHPPEVGLWIDW